MWEPPISAWEIFVVRVEDGFWAQTIWNKVYKNVIERILYSAWGHILYFC